MEMISNCSQDQIKRAAGALKAGNLVAFPTETVYGLGADAQSSAAVSRVYSVKGRPLNHPLIVHVSSLNHLDDWARQIPDYARTLASNFWPGPMTLILKRSDLAKDFITGGKDYVGIRVPNQQIALNLLNEFEALGGSGIAAPSANRFGAVSPTTAQAVEVELSQFLDEGDLILDSGQCPIGIESSIIDCTKLEPALLRPGSITREMICEITGILSHKDSKPNETRVSGSLPAHYAPKAKVVLDAQAEPGDGFIALVDVPTPVGAIRLAAPKNIEMYAKVLYQSLRLADQHSLKKIVIIQPLGGGLAPAIRDRLNKAASVHSAVK